MRPTPLARSFVLTLALVLVTGAAAFAQGAPGLPGESASPLAAYPGFGHDWRADEARFDREAMARELLVSDCMEKAGFDYWPQPPVTVEVKTLPPRALARIEENPNDAYVAGLDPERRTAYHLAFYGVVDPNDPRAVALHDPASPTGGGCQAAALREIPGVFAAKSALTEELLALEREVRADERVVAAERAWAGCMASAGYDYASTRSLDAALDEAVAQGLGQGLQMAEIVRDQQSAVQKARTCGAAVGLEATARAVRVEAETAFVAAHRELLEAHRARLAAQRLPGAER